MIVYQRPTFCLICGSTLEQGPRGVVDHVYGVAGKWNLTRCGNRDCAAIFLDHSLTADELSGFYSSYSTHSPPVLNVKGFKRAYRSVLEAIRSARLGYPKVHSEPARITAGLMGRLPYFREEAQSRVFWLPYMANGTVVEVGFGNAQSLLLLREAGWRVRGVEFDPHCISSARSLGLEVFEGDFTAGLFDENSADAVVASHAIEHVPDPRAFMDEAYRVLRPNGLIVLRTPNAASRDARRSGVDWRGLEVPRHLTIHTPESLTMLGRLAGFEDVQVFGTPLGGFIAQQSGEIRQGRKPRQSQSPRTIAYNIAETLLYMVSNQSCSEIVFMGRKAG